MINEIDTLNEIVTQSLSNAKAVRTTTVIIIDFLYNVHPIYLEQPKFAVDNIQFEVFQLIVNKDYTSITVFDNSMSSNR